MIPSDESTPTKETHHDWVVETLHEAPAAPDTIPMQVFRIAETYPVAREIVDRWLYASMPIEQALVMIILELSQRLGATEQAFQSVLQDLRREDKP